jgi:hypothetical protein
MYIEYLVLAAVVAAATLVFYTGVNQDGTPSKGGIQTDNGPLRVALKAAFKTACRQVGGTACVE